VKIKTCKFGKSQRGVLEIDLAMAMLILAVAIMPLAFSLTKEHAAFRADYYRAVADEVVDGEMEILAAGDWKNFPDGSSTYTVHSRAAANLPSGHFVLTKTAHHLQLEWQPDKRRGIGAVVREVTIP